MITRGMTLSCLRTPMASITMLMGIRIFPMIQGVGLSLMGMRLIGGSERPQCANGLDDDNDGRVDLADQGVVAWLTHGNSMSPMNGQSVAIRSA